MTGPVDLTGRQPTWPATAISLWRSCMAAASRSGELWRTPAPQGDDVLREELGRVLRADAARITITAGIRASALTYARADRDIAVERPTFAGAVDVLRAAGARVALYDWCELLHGPPPPERTLWLTSPCRNPDGATLTPPDRAALERRLGAGYRVVINSAYRWYAPDECDVAGTDTLGTLHKLAGHGVRLGWVCSDDYFERATAELIGTTPSPVWQRAWGRFLRADGLALLVGHTVEPALAAAVVFRQRVDHRLRTPPAAGPHVLLPLTPVTGEEAALARLADTGLRLSGGAAFHSPVPALRASFAGAPAGAAARLADLVTRSGLFAVDTVG
jgi:DNA-binding transcriptional MocR family regulator